MSSEQLIRILQDVEEDYEYSDEDSLNEEDLLVITFLFIFFRHVVNIQFHNNINICVLIAT